MIDLTDGLDATDLKYWEAAKNAEVDPESGAFTAVSAAELAERRSRVLRLSNYLERLLRMTADTDAGSAAIYLLFDADGCVIEAFQNNAGYTAPETSAMRLGTMWNFETMGPNAVTVGCAEGKAVATVGDVNYNVSLKDFAVYYAPILVLNCPSPHSVWCQGGIAVLLPAAEANREFLTLARMMAHDLTLNLHLFLTAYWAFSSIGQATLSVHELYKPGSFVISRCDSLLLETFQLPAFDSDVLFQPVETLVDPLPCNREFWSIIEQMIAVSDRSLVITVHGKDIPCIVTSFPVEQPTLGFRGVDFIITTDKQLSTQIASRIGNRAIRSFEDIVGESPAFRRTVDRARMLSPTSSNALLIGESGTGKDVFAQAIHNSSPRRKGPFVAVNCAAIPRDLLASELFGYESGAFTGARRQGNIGKFELANGGTIFLDEIGELPLDLQASLLRVVEQKQFMRLGGSKLIDADVKIISATNADLVSMIQQKLFRADLYYRLGTIQLVVPPLRERGEDVILLAEYFIRRVSQRIGRPDYMTISPSAQKLLMQLPWPGNVRELQNLIERIVQLCPEPILEPKHILDNLDSDEIGAAPAARTADVLPAAVPAAAEAPGALPGEELSAQDRQLLQKRRPLTRGELLDALKKCGGNRTKAAASLGIARKTLYRYLEQFENE